MEKFEAYCLPKKNLVIERRKFFTRNQQPEEAIESKPSKPLESIMKKPLARPSARLKKTLLRLQKFDFHSSHKSRSKMVLADALLRASLKGADPEISEKELVTQIYMVYSNNEVTGTNLE